HAAAAPPPAYGSAPAALAQATALYVYQPTDAGDLALQPNDHVTVLEYMNAEWWKGRSTRTGQEGIFPRSYVRVVEDNNMNKTAGAYPMVAPVPVQQNSGGGGYGNVPLEVSGAGNGDGRVPTKGQEMGKKFGKKLGNAAIFGAGATIGGNIVNSIF
ncbi:hypothetical protein LTR28_013296, partial [Elasticomyces elasticus]